MLIEILHITIHKIKTIYNFYTNGGVYTQKDNYINLNFMVYIYIYALLTGKLNIQIKNILIN